MANTVNSTTLSAALDKSDESFSVAAATYTLKDSILFCEGEAMRVMAAPSGTFLPKVWRGYASTTATKHPSGAVVWAGTPDQFYDNDPSGAGVAANEMYLPHINLQTKSVWTIVNGIWQRFWDRGVPVALPIGARTQYTAAGALTLVGGTHELLGGAANAMTLAAPNGNTPEGTIMHIVAGDAYAYTVTQASNIGFLNTGSSSDVATFAATAGAGFTIQNIGGAWRCIGIIAIANTSTVTFG